ncbi:MAG: hypothetical protein ACRC30_06295 [Clostridium sp.]
MTSIGYTIANLLDCIQPIASGIIFYIIGAVIDKTKLREKVLE